MTAIVTTAEVLPAEDTAAPFTPVGLVIVGYGRWGANHARAASAAHGIALQGVVDPRPSARDAAQQSCGVPAFASLEQALNDRGIEAVVIATPAATHTEVVREALHSGRHVLVEKPAAMSLAEARAIAAEADSRGVQLSAGHTFLYTQPVRNLARWLREAAPSRPWLVRSERLGGQRREDCDVLWNFGPHDVSILLHLLAEPVAEVTARGHRFPGGRHLDGVTLDLGFASGVRGEVYLGWRHPGAKRSLRLLGEDWAIKYRHGHLDGEDTLTRSGPQGPRQIDDLLAEGCQQSPRGGLHGYREPLKAELEEFALACRSGKPTVTGPEHLVAVTSVLEAAARSAELGGRMLTPEPARRPRSARSASAAFEPAGQTEQRH
ncbi:Gfo/Idh/MocA family protein [Kitasatospora sp. NPDC001175]|uniref:Gfo/Idh/MocA family protein n=1 Tax=Kitasatospora sp. NPDC001175 TaxID=3157103 RepID=UPI003D021CB0